MEEQLGYYSATMARECGSVWWTRADGTEVNVTSVGECPLYEDTVCVGPVTAHSRGNMRTEADWFAYKLSLLKQTYLRNFTNHENPPWFRQ